MVDFATALKKKRKKDVDIAPSSTFVANQSKVKTRRQCQQAYHFRYVEHLVKRVKPRPLTFGGIVHEMIEAFANGDDPFEKLAEAEKKQGKLFRSEVEEYGDIVADLRCIMTDYFDYWPENSLTYVRFQKRAAEHLFAIEIDDGITFKGKIDAFAKAKGLRWMVEHKTWKRALPSTDERWRNVQSPVYTRAIDMMGWPAVDGVLWDYIRSKPPSAPELLKNGGISRRQIDSLPAKIADWVQKKSDEGVKITGKDVDTLTRAVSKNRERYFQRIFNPTKRQVVDKVFADFLITAREMRDNHGKPPVKTIGMHCGWCQYEQLCRAEMTGGDVDFLKEREYRVEQDEKRYEVEVE